MAMYHVKGLGKNAYKFFGPEIGTVESSRIQIESCLRTALAAREFELYFQPQYRMDRSLVGFEALLRWNSPKLGMVSPAVFIPVAEQTGLIVPIGQWVLEEACRQIAAWSAAGHTAFRVAVNVSAFQFAREDFPESVAQFLRVMGISPERIELELTETAIMTDISKSSAQLRELRDLGLAVWIDDFGTGYSSLSYLQRLPVDGIKIDQSFVKDLSSDPVSALPMIEAIVNLAHNLNLRVMAEGVETEEQLQFLRDASCDLAQGYLFSRALPGAEATAVLASQQETAKTNAEELLVLR
jgi:EAL domain-containing protein (putative c-di-GMP-specific phosphodiesterase class I)